jgi:hypothetical protein
MNLCTFSPCRTYRYSLVHEWDPDLPRVCFLMLNPSTADERQLDPTLRRCKGFASLWGYGSFEIGNIFAYRATDPREMKAAHDPFGPDNVTHLMRMLRDHAMVVAAWGVHGKHRNGVGVVERCMPIGKTLHALATAKDGSPKHPLYLRSDLTPKHFMTRRAA